MVNILDSKSKDEGSSPSRPATPSLEDFGVAYLKLILGWSWCRIGVTYSIDPDDIPPVFEKTLEYVMGLKVAGGG